MSAVMSRAWAMPTRDTFECQPIAALVRRHCEGESYDPFARNSSLAKYTNDLDPTTCARWHMDAEKWLLMMADTGNKADCIILDPPYSPRQISECYASIGLKASQQDTQNAALYARVRRAARKLCRPGTKVLSFGWNSAGMGEGFDTLEILLVAHGGAHNDTICKVEQLRHCDIGGR